MSQDSPAQLGENQRAGDSVRGRLARLTPEKRALLERLLREKGQSDEVASRRLASPIARRDADDVPVASFAQRQMWLLEQLAQGTALHTIALHFRIQGPLLIGALEGALKEVVRRHEPLRTTFKLRDGLPSPVLQSVPDSLLTVFDVSPLPAPHADVRRRIAEQISLPFDLYRDRPFRVQLFRFEDEDYELLITVHHVAFDRWSTAILLRELSALYRAFVHGTFIPIPELPIRYSDFAAWQHTQLDEASLQSSIAYWRTQLQDAPPWLELPTDRSRPANPSYRGGLAKSELPRVLCEALDALCKSDGVTHFVALFAVYQLLLQRYSGQEQIIVGTPITGREHPEVEDLIGVFVNSLPLVTDLSGPDLTFRELLVRVRNVVAGAFRHQHLPFERLAMSLNPRRRPGTSPVFQTMFTLHPGNNIEFTLDGCAVNELTVDSDTIEHDLRMWVAPTPGATGRANLGALAQGMIVRLRYSTDLFDGATVERMLSHYQRLLESAVKTPDRCLSELSLLTDAERHQLLGEWNDTAYALPQPLGVHQLFSAQATRSPDAIALVFEDQLLTYRELDARSNRLAHELRGLGVGPEVLVGLFLERSVELIVSLLGTLKAGGAYLPIDPALPRGRIAFMLKDAQPAVILAQRSLAERLPASSVPCIFPDTHTGIERGSQAALPGSGSSSHLVYVLYTSGSTGEPKGVCVEQLALCNLLWGMQRLLDFRSSDVLVATTPLSFDIAGLEIWLPLVTGARLVLAAESAARDSFALDALLRVSGATVFQATPAGWRGLFAAGWRGSEQLLAMVGGEALPEDLADRLASQTRQAWNVYGPTETTIWSTAKRLSPGARPVAIGRPIANTTVYVLDAHGQAVPVGVPGEIYIGGCGLARGYLNRPRLTAERFVPSPFPETRSGEEPSAPAERLYRTGDLGRFLPDGNIEYLGRIDHQVKLRGHRIELGEIENLLLRHPAVCQAVVIVREDVPDNRYLAAYVVLHDSLALDEPALRRHLQDALPPYMVPAVFLALPALPLSRHGKVDRAALPAPVHARAQGRAAAIPARDAVEHALILIWEGLLAVRPIGIRDDFFELGGASLLAVRLMVRVHERFGALIPMGSFLQNPTVESLAELLRGQAAQPASSWAAPLQARGSGPPFFCVTGRGGLVSAYVELARQLGHDRPFYTLSGPGLYDQRPLLTQVAELASQCLAALRSVQPAGPYLLGGYSFGGLVAFEMAQQLRQCGQEVARLALLDSWLCLPSRQELAPTDAEDDQRILWMLARDLGVRLDRAAVLALSKEAAWAQVHDALVQHSLLPAGMGFAQLQRGIALVKASEQAAKHYAPRPYSGSMICFVATLQDSAADALQPAPSNAAAGWRALSPSPLKVCEVPGDHRSILQPPNVQILAAQLRAFLSGGSA